MGNYFSCSYFIELFFNRSPSSFKILLMKRMVRIIINQGLLGPQGPWVHYAPKSTLFLGVFESLGYL